MKSTNGLGLNNIPILIDRNKYSYNITVLRTYILKTT